MTISENNIKQKKSEQGLADGVGSETSWKDYPILVVDDEKGVVDTIRLALKLEGFNCRTAMSGEEALVMLGDSPARLIISDYAMAPGMNGVEFLTKVRDLYPDTVTMILSAHAESQIILSAVNDAGAFQYLVKPYTDDDLILRVSQALKYYHAQHNIRRLALAKKKLLKRMSHEENASLMGSFSKILSEKFSDTVTELIWGATQESMGLNPTRQLAVSREKKNSRLHLATILKKLSRLGHYTELATYRTFQPISLISLLGQLIDQAKFAASHAEINIEVIENFNSEDSRLCVNMLSDLLSLGIRAVIENAIVHREHSGSPCCVTVSTMVRISDGERLIDVDIRDNGGGISLPEADIFSPLITSAVDHVAMGGKIPKLSEYNLTPAGHVGLGLTLARWAITKHDGDIHLVESDRSGSLFRISLPLA